MPDKKSESPDGPKTVDKCVIIMQFAVTAT
jgi:hypothetical protein